MTALDPGDPEHRAWAYRQAAMALDPELYAGGIDDLQRWADEAEAKARDAADRQLAEEAVDATERDQHAWGSTPWRNLAIDAALAAIRAERARAEATS